eukprot:TRINITY_DN404_c0_g1_i2.p1 TRINITY_DN404_c0_g1~~TRINITY_DN404_c0_g1_i2.p1  ORF type:complete len:375 (-),score=82.51 TRINITY_DN404_c0_g1_i2:70-1194(-)
MFTLTESQTIAAHQLAHNNEQELVPEPSSHDRQGYRSIRLAGIANMRDIGGLPIAGTNRVVKKKMFYRSAAPTYATEEDKEYLLGKLDIMTLIDFRTTYETKNLNFGKPKYEDNFLLFSVKEDTVISKDIDKTDPTKEALIMEEISSYPVLKRLYKGTPRVGERRNSLNGVVRKRYHIPLINDHYFFQGIYPGAPASVKLKANAVRYILQSDKIASYFLLKHLNEMGLFEMYRITVDHVQREVLTVFSVLRKMDNYPINIFCSLGKDRTGMMTALLLSCLGVPREIIIEDYHETDSHLASSLPKIQKYFISVGLTKEEFVLAPREIMAKFLEYLDKKYGGPCEYLNQIGFTFEDQKYVYDMLTEEAPLASIPDN